MRINLTTPIWCSPSGLYKVVTHNFMNSLVQERLNLVAEKPASNRHAAGGSRARLSDPLPGLVRRRVSADGMGSFCT